jgi:hypothetical protein
MVPKEVFVVDTPEKNAWIEKLIWWIEKHRKKSDWLNGPITYKKEVNGYGECLTTIMMPHKRLKRIQNEGKYDEHDKRELNAMIEAYRWYIDNNINLSSMRK